MSARATVLVLAGSTEASELVRHLAVAHPTTRVVASFAGRTRVRVTTPQTVDVRVGGFGGIDGLRDHLRSGAVDSVVDATHPFASCMPFHAHAACTAEHVPLLRLVRPSWPFQPGDRWTAVADMDRAAQAVVDSGADRVLLTIGRQELRAFSRCQAHLIARSIDPPDPVVLAMMPAAEIVLARGPFSLDAELELLQARRIDLIVAKNSGGAATRAKVDAARQLGIPMVMVGRPPMPPVDTVASVVAAMHWLVERCPGFA